MKIVKIVIGANFGDEGKGLMTDYFCREAHREGKRCLVIAHNGGAQRGHTVRRGKDYSHVFHHFGSGSFSGADTYLSKDFICNPMVFRKEWEELESQGCQPNVFLHPQCRITTPFDMILNQLAEESRSDSRHGSCGMGIYETIYRDKVEENTGKPFRAAEMYQDNPQEIEKHLRWIREEYFPCRQNSLCICADKEWQEIISRDELIFHYLEDLDFMKNRTKFAEVSIFDAYDTLVFEGGQGLLLDQNNTAYFPHLTPSNTGRKNPENLLSSWRAASAAAEQLETEVCYVTRPYLTRHGAGRLDGECKKEEINADMVDLTNVPNPYQGSLRYGKMDMEALAKRIIHDFGKDNHGKCSLAVTHVNENKDGFPEYIRKKQLFHQLYLSDADDSSAVRKG